VLGHLSRDCNRPELAFAAVQTVLEECGRREMEIHCAAQNEISPRFRVGETLSQAFQPSFDSIFFQTA
jgi:hypothetical protein